MDGSRRVLLSISVGINGNLNGAPAPSGGLEKARRQVRREEGMVAEIALSLLRQGLYEGIERLDEFLHALML